MNIKLDEEQMRNIVSKAILEGLGTEQKDMLIQGALQYLLSVPDSGNPGFGQRRDGRTVLQKIFDQQLEYYANRICTEYLETGENMQKLRETVIAAVDTHLSNTDTYKDLSQKFASAIGSAFRTHF